MSGSTISAVATAAGPGAIGIVRVSGPLVPQIVQAVASFIPAPRTVSLQSFRTPEGNKLDQGLVIYFKAAASYTGEDMAEFHAHGGQLVLAKLLQSTYSAGAVPARPGEFSERAFLNGKLDLLQAEAVADMISVGSERALNAAMTALSGVFSAQITRVADRLTSIRAALEASIDFSDDVTSAEVATDLFNEVNELRREICNLACAGNRGAVLAHGVNTVILGRPNTGKSTLMNRLAGESRAIVTSQPGTTRDVLHVDVNLNGLLLSLHDTAGIHNSDNEIEREGIRRALDAASKADLILYVHDASDPKLDISELNTGAQRSRLIKVLNKIDLTGEPPSIGEDSGIPKVYLSAHTGIGVELLRQTILNTMDVSNEADSVFLARERHIAALDRAVNALNFESPAELVEATELTAERLRLAHAALGEVTGIFASEDLLGTIFSRFCIGK